MTASCASSTSQNDNGSLESYNRAVYKFNNQFYKYVMKPVSKGYPYIMAGDIKEDGIDFNNGLFMDEKNHRELFNKAHP